MAIFSVALTGKECELTHTEEARCSVLFFFPLKCRLKMRFVRMRLIGPGVELVYRQNRLYGQAGSCPRKCHEKPRAQ